MTIKKSVLEQKWHYRITKVFLLSLPILAALIVIVQGDVKKGDAIASLLLFTVIGWVIWAIILNAAWRLLLYIIFGGLDDDLKQKKPESVPALAYTAPVRTQQGQPSAVVVAILIFVIFTIMVMAFAASN